MRKVSYKRVLIITFISIHILLGMILSGCKTNTIYVPVETVKTEYKDKLLRDSIFLRDSVFIQMRNDTVLLEKYRYMYRDRFIRDSIFITDSIQIPYPIKGDTEYVNRISWWQQLLIVLGAISLGVVAYKIYSFFRRR